MKNRADAIARIQTEALHLKLRLPFERGAPRAAMIARRRLKAAEKAPDARRRAAS